MSPNRTLAQLISISIALTIATLGLAQQPATAAAQKVIGTVKGADARTIKVKLDSGADTTVIVQDSTVLRRLPYGGSLKDAQTITLAEVEAGDRILARGRPEQNGGPVIADEVVIVEHRDAVEGQQRDRADWEKRGVSGAVIAIDLSKNSVTISRSGNKTVVSITPKTKILRYTDTGKFADAKGSTLEHIAIGDLFRARGDRDIKSNSVIAEEVVFGPCGSDNPDCRQ